MDLPDCPICVMAIKREWPEEVLVQRCALCGNALRDHLQAHPHPHYYRHNCAGFTYVIDETFED